MTYIYYYDRSIKQQNIEEQQPQKKKEKEENLQVEKEESLKQLMFLKNPKIIDPLPDIFKELHILLFNIDNKQDEQFLKRYIIAYLFLLY